MDQGYDVDGSVPTELKVEREEVNAGGRRPVTMQDLAVEFGIWKNERGQYKVYNMTLPGGHPLTQDALENRITMGPQQYQGTIAIWNWRHGWGFIRAEPTTVLPPRVVAKLAQQHQAAMARGKKVSADDKMFYFRRTDCMQGYAPRKDMQVSFQLYVDDKGAGASEIINLSD
jgi:cold shock CspA family protein